MSASVVGVWGYQAAKRILDEELVVELQDVGRIVESGVRHDVGDVESAADGSLGASMVPLIDRGASAAELQDRLRPRSELRPRAFCSCGSSTAKARSLAASTEHDRRERAGRPRSPIAFSLEGKPFVSEPYLLEDLQAPGRQHQPAGASTRRSTVRLAHRRRAGTISQRSSAELVRDSKFNQSGYAVLVDGDGQIIAHPDPTRLNEDVSSYPAVQRARAVARRRGGHRARTRRHRSRLFVYRRIAEPGDARAGSPGSC